MEGAEPKVVTKFDPSDIQPGTLSDNWLLSAVSILAERPALLERIFLTKDYNEAGLYQLRLCHNGEWQTLVLDDYFPCYPNGGPIFSHSKHENELWVLLLEKAYAKLHGGYKTLQGGSTSDALFNLTGAPTMSLCFKDEKVKQMLSAGKIWDLVKHFLDEGYLVSGGSSSQEMWG